MLEKIGGFLSELSADVMAKMLMGSEILLLLQALRRANADFRMKHEYYKMLGYIWDVGKEEHYQKIRDSLIKGGDFDQWKTLIDFCPISMCDQLRDDLVSDFKKMSVDYRHAAYSFLKEELAKGLADAEYWEKESWEALKLSRAGVLKMYAEILTICKERKGWKVRIWEQTKIQ